MMHLFIYFLSDDYGSLLTKSYLLDVPVERSCITWATISLGCDWIKLSRTWKAAAPGNTNFLWTSSLTLSFSTMVLPVTQANNVKVYTVSGGLGSRSIPDWIVRKRKRQLKKDLGKTIYDSRIQGWDLTLWSITEYSTRVELIQDFEFPQASNCIRTSRDGNFVIATGTYKPQMRVYEYAEASMKFERHTDCESLKFEVWFLIDNKRKEDGKNLSRGLCM